MSGGRRGSRGRAPRGGFTLVEIIVSVLIMGLMLAGVSQMLTSVRTTRDLIHNMQETQNTGPVILDLIERDLRAIYTTNLPRDLHLRVENRVLLGEDADRIDFITTTDSLLWNREGERDVRADVNEVGYCLRSNPANDDFREIYRREGFGVDDEPQSGGQYIFLHDKVVSFDVQVYAEDGPDAEPLEDWGLDPSDPETTGLPASLHFTLVIEIEPRLLYETQGRMRIAQKRTFERTVRLPQELRVEPQDIPRLGVPSAPAAGGEEVLGEGGEGTDEPGEGGAGEGEGEGVPDPGQGGGGGAGLGGGGGGAGGG